MERDIPALFFEDRPGIFGFSTRSCFPAFLTGNFQKPGFYSAKQIVGSSPFSSPTVSPLDPMGFAPNLATHQQKKPIYSSSSADRSPRTIDFPSKKLKQPKLEPINDKDQLISSAQQIGNSSFEFPTEKLLQIRSSNVHRLPELLSIEQLPDLHSFFPSESYFQTLALSPPSDPRTLLHLQPSDHQRTLATQRRKKISDRIRKLEKLMPWERKMDIATMLEEAHKYIRFLEAQVSVLQSMSCESDYEYVAWAGEDVLWRQEPSRQQLMQLLVNSASVQEKLYSSGCCFFTTEQVLVLKKAFEKKPLLQQMALLT